MRHKIYLLMIISNVDRFTFFEDMDSYLAEENFDITYIIMNPGDSFIEQWLKKKGRKIKKITLSSSKLSWIRAGFKLWWYLVFKRPRIIHCHFYEANVIGLTAAYFAGIKNRIYTRHFSNYNHLYFPKGVIIDKFYNKLATNIISISGVVTETLVKLESLNPSKIRLLPNGVNIKAFEQVELQRIETIYSKYLIPNDKFIVGVISRVEELKGLQYIIPAFKKFHQLYPDSIITFYNVNGNYPLFFELLKELPEDSYRLIKFEIDMPAVYQTFDTFVHTPIDREVEAFGLIYIEALAAGVPSIFSLSGIANDFIEDQKNAWVVPHKNSEEIYKALVSIYLDASKRILITKNGKKDVNRYRIEHSLSAHKALYELIGR